jgi:hypothetical protein
MRLEQLAFFLAQGVFLFDPIFVGLNFQARDSEPGDAILHRTHSAALEA